MTDAEMRSMLIEYMGKGFLDNIIAMMKQDHAVCRFIPDLLGDDSMHVRLGATALIEELADEHCAGLKMAVPGIIALLGHENPTIRGDAANALGIIKDGSAIAALRTSLQDSHTRVREAAQDALAEMERGL